MKPNIFAVVVTYRPQPTALLSLVEQLSRQVDWIIVVDNTDAHNNIVLEILSSHSGFPNRISLVRFGKNLGIATALNVGIDAALREGCTHVLLSDQDSLPSHGMVAGLLGAEREAIDRGRRVGAVGPVYIDKVTGIASPFQVKNPGHLFYSRIHIAHNQPNREVLSLITSGTLINRSAISHIGLMREEMFVDYVDVEWCHRAIAHGYVLIASAAGSMIHDIGDTRIRVWWLRWRYVSGYSGIRLYYRFRNFGYLLKLPYVPRGWKIRALWFWCGELYAHVIFARGRARNLRQIASGLIDGIRGRMGPARIR